MTFFLLCLSVQRKCIPQNSPDLQETRCSRITPLMGSGALCRQPWTLYRRPGLSFKLLSTGRLWPWSWQFLSLSISVLLCGNEDVISRTDFLVLRSQESHPNNVYFQGPLGVPSARREPFHPADVETSQIYRVVCMGRQPEGKAGCPTDTDPHLSAE